MTSNINNLITDNIANWALAIKKRNATGRGSSKKIELYGIKKLRELILELAVRGKLVPQNSEDEPASALLEQVAIEKAQFEKEKKVKKTKKLPEITKEEIPYDLPNGWQWSRLGHIGVIFNGNSISARVKEAQYTGIEGLPFIATKDVGYGFESFDYDNGINIPVGESKFKVAHKGALLICAEGGSAGKKCGIAEKDICFGNKLFANELHTGFEERFILTSYLSPSFFIQFRNSMTGIIGGIASSKFAELLIPVPPSQEQVRIATKVNELMSLCDQLEQQTEASLNAHKTLVENLLATLTNSASVEELEQNWNRIAEHFTTLFTTEESIDQLKQTALQLAVMGKLVPQDPNDEPASTLLEKIAAEKAQLIKDKKLKKQKLLPQIGEDEKPFELPFGWEWCRIAGSMDPERDISYGIIKLEAEPEAGGIPTLRCSDVKPRYIDTSSVRSVSPQTEEPYKRTRLQGGEVLVNIRGTLGGVAHVPKELAGFNIAREVAMLPVHQGVSSEYLVDVIASPFFWKMIETNLKGIAYKGLNLNTLRDLAFPLPPEKEQPRIVEKVFQLMSLCNQLKTQIQQAQQTRLHLADAMVSRTVGAEIMLNANTKVKDDIQTMSITTILSLGNINFTKEAIIAPLVSKAGDNADARVIWNQTKLALPEFYRQLKVEIDAGYLAMPAQANFTS